MFFLLPIPNQLFQIQIADHLSIHIPADQLLLPAFVALILLLPINLQRLLFFSDNRKDLSKLKIPSLILQCSEDIIAPVEVGKFIHRNLPGSTLKVMKATGHCPHMSEPDETIELIKEYLGVTVTA